MMAITGTDELSLKILDAFKDGAKLKDIASMFPVSLDQAKRVSRYSNYLEQARTHLHRNEVEKIQTIGFKALYLAPLFKEKDWEGLSEVLSAINEDTKRDEFPLFIQALEEKRKRISGFQQEIESKLNRLEQREKELHILENNIKETQEKIKKETAFLSKYPENVQSFLVKHLGLYDNKLVLARRLDSRWQSSLKKKGVLTYDKREFVWFVNDLDALVEDYLFRINRKKQLLTEWDRKKEEERWGYSNTPYSADYKLPEGLASDLQSALGEVEEKVKEIDSERADIQKEMKELRRTSPQSFIEAIEASIVLSAHDIKRHGELQDKALKWLYNRGYIVTSEITLPNGRRADVIGFNEQGAYRHHRGKGFNF